MLPTFLYEALPYLYGLAGILAATQLDSGLGRFSGGLLFLMGIYIWALRRHYRSQWQ